MRSRHAAQYGCIEAYVDVREVSQRTFVAEGCEWRAIYICDRRTCELDGEPTPTSDGPYDWSSGRRSTGG